MAVTLLSVHQAATDLLDCVCEALGRIPAEMPGLDGCPCRTCVVPGEPAADGCDEGCTQLPEGQYPGQLTVHTRRIYVTERDRFTDFRAVRLDATGCATDAITAVDLSVTLFRCIPLPTDEGCPPSCEELSGSAMQTHVDMLAILQGITCCFPGTDTTSRRGRRYAIGQTRTIGPQGGCIGVQTDVTVALDQVAPPVP